MASVRKERRGGGGLVCQKAKLGGVSSDWSLPNRFRGGPNATRSEEMLGAPGASVNQRAGSGGGKRALCMHVYCISN